MMRETLIFCENFSGLPNDKEALIRGCQTNILLFMFQSKMTLFGDKEKHQPSLTRLWDCRNEIARNQRCTQGSLSSYLHDICYSTNMNMNTRISSNLRSDKLSSPFQTDKKRRGNKAFKPENQQLRLATAPRTRTELSFDLMQQEGNIQVLPRLSCQNVSVQSRCRKGGI